jgi:hypothetical protein
MGNHSSSNNENALTGTDSARQSLNCSKKSGNAISENTTTQASSLNEVKETKIRTLFEWKDGGNVVFLVGTFSNWSQLFSLTKKDNKSFEVYLVKNY